MKITTLEELKELGAIILLPNADAYKKATNADEKIYTRSYFYGIRILFGDFNWKQYEHWMGREKIYLDDTVVPKKER